jgi:hypothetical protein
MNQIGLLVDNIDGKSEQLISIAETASTEAKKRNLKIPNI